MTLPYICVACGRCAGGAGDRAGRHGGSARSPSALALMWLSLAVAEWAVAYALELSVSSHIGVEAYVG